MGNSLFPFGNRLTYHVQLYRKLLLGKSLRFSNRLDVFTEHGAASFRPTLTPIIGRAARCHKQWALTFQRKCEQPPVRCKFFVTPRRFSPFQREETGLPPEKDFFALYNRGFFMYNKCEYNL